MRTPNILFIQVDQLAPALTQPYGSEVAKTPHLAALAASGTVFENAYCNFPLCAPSRASMVREGLRRAIFSGELTPGTPLRQDELAERFGISRIPVREALRQLEAEGLVFMLPIAERRFEPFHSKRCSS